MRKHDEKGRVGEGLTEVTEREQLIVSHSGEKLENSICRGENHVG